MSARRLLWPVVRMAVGTALAAAALYVLSLRIDRAQFESAFAQARASWIAVGVASALVTLALVTTRWGLLVGAGRSPAVWRTMWSAVVVGQAVNIMLPLRFGEAARLALTCRALGRPPGGVIVGLAFERVLDLAAFGAAVLFLFTAGRMPDAFSGAVPTALLLGVATIGAVLLAVRLMPPALHWLRARVRGQSRLARWIDAQEADVRIGWSGIVHRRRLGVLGVLTALILVSSASTNYLVFQAFGLPVPPLAALVLLAVLQVGTAVVSVPGNIGVFHYLTVVTLATWQIPEPVALAAAIVLHAVSLGPRVVLGAIALVRAPPAAPPT